MMEKTKLIRWIKENRKVLIATGISIGLIIAIVLGIKNADALKAVWASLRNTTAKAAMDTGKHSAHMITNQARITVARNNPVGPFDVSAHLRNLHEGCHASAEKIATALENGFSLKEGQTWVEAYTKGIAA